MKKHELLVPVGNIEALYQAVYNGCDAVYLGGKKFGARKFASNFDEQEMIEAIHFCHLYKVKIYVTVNTLIYSDELEECLKYVYFLYENGVDAVIMQDIGLINLVRHHFPDLVIHASTQMHNHNKEGLLYLKSLGIKRIVLARELSLEEIKTMDVDIELEVFIHGALCICYSGCCLYSSMVGGRSGNRGECAGSCRLPYKLIEDGKEIETKGEFLLSPKELNTSLKLKELMNSNITSFKIEGRMKSPEYVGFITKFYRTLMDEYEQHQTITITKEKVEQLLKLFNRDFTLGHLFSSHGTDLMNIKFSNHQGFLIGSVIQVSKDFIKIELNSSLCQGDGIRFIKTNEGMIVNKIYNQKRLLIHEAKEGEIVYLDNKINLKVEGPIHKTLDVKLIEQLKQVEPLKMSISLSVKAKIGQMLVISYRLDDIVVTKKGSIVELAKNSPLNKEDIISRLSKLGNTPFLVENTLIEMDNNVFISIKELNEIRRSLIDELIRKRTFTKQSKKWVPYSITKITSTSKTIHFHALVRTEEQLLFLSQFSFSSLYITDLKLYQKYKNKIPNLYLRLDRVMKNFKDYENERLLVGEMGSIYKYKEKNCLVGDYYLNVTNYSSISTYLNSGLERVTLSVEMDMDKLKTCTTTCKNILGTCDKIEFIIYGRVELMVSKYCPLNLVKSQIEECNHCQKGHVYHLRDRMGKDYPLLFEKCLLHIMHYKPLDFISSFDSLYNMGINNFRLEFFNESIEDIKNILTKLNIAKF